MRFIDRTDELARLTRAAESERGGLLVLYGRRRVGKTRLLLEWARRVGGLYTVADQSAAEVQRRYLAGGVATLFPGGGMARSPGASSAHSSAAFSPSSRGRGLLDDHTVADMLEWQETGGFSLDASVRIHGSAARQRRATRPTRQDSIL